MPETVKTLQVHIEDLSRAIGRNVGKNKEQDLSSEQEDVLKVFQLPKQKVVFAWPKDNKLGVFIEQNSKKIKISLEDIEGIPNECFADRRKMTVFLTQSNLSVSEYLNSKDEFRLRASLKLKGGGNIGVHIKTWPIKVDEEGKERREKFHIPYRLNTSSEAAASILSSRNRVKLIGELDQQINMLETSISEGREKEGEYYEDERDREEDEEGEVHDKKGRTELEELRFLKELRELRDEISGFLAAEKAIKKWNETGLVKLTPLLSAPREGERWVDFYTKFYTTKDDEGICEVACIGMCDNQADKDVITCDLEHTPVAEREVSILHEIGHIIGLRHEHARGDRNSYVKTTFSLEPSEPVGAYDFRSVMHYPLSDKYVDPKTGRVDKLQVQKSMSEFLKRNFPEEANELFPKIGMNPVISDGDKESVRKLLIKAQEVKRREEEIALAAAAAAEARAAAAAASKSRARAKSVELQEFFKELRKNAENAHQQRIKGGKLYPYFR